VVGARLLPACALILAGCSEAAPLADAQAAVAATVAPAVVAVREIVPELPAPVPPTIHPAAVDLIVEFEVSSPAYYRSRLSGVYWPGGASGPTWGIGYDGGHQTRTRILDDWQTHEARQRLAETAGLTGNTARDRIPDWRDITTPFALASNVFAHASLPEYLRRAERAFGPSIDNVPATAEGALVSLVYNRGGSMTGNARREMRAIRDRCLPAGDVDCIAAELRAMCRLWEGTPNGPGLCRRRNAEADLAETPP
jgi:hypothetical protein